MLQRRWFPDAIEGERVVLRRHTRDNLRAFLRWYADPEVARLTRYQDGPMRPDEIERFFAVRALGPDSLAMAIHVRDGGRLIGSCAFSQLDGDNGSALFHITIGEHDAWGRGYGSEATALMVDHAFAVLGLHRVALSVFAFNERAIRAYERVGFTREGSSREAIWRDGRWWDEIHMSVLEPEWRARRWTDREAAVAVAGGGADTLPRLQPEREHASEASRDPHASEASRMPHASEASRDPHASEASRMPHAPEASRDSHPDDHDRAPAPRAMDRLLHAIASTRRGGG